MANTTDPGAQYVHNMNPQFLVEKIVRAKIYAHTFWKESCFGLNSETLVDRAIELKYIGGTYGGTRKPTKFLCLVLKMLQIQPEKEIIYEFLKAKDYKYVTALAMFYLRLIGKPEEVYQCLEPFYSDNRKLIRRKGDGRFEVIHMDEYAYELMNSDSCLDVVLTRIPKRPILEDNGTLEPRVSALEEDLIDEAEEQAQIENGNNNNNNKENGENLVKDSENNNEITENNNEITENKKEKEKDGSSERKHRKHRKRSKSRSHSHHHHKKDKNKWRKVVKGGKRSRSRSKDRNDKETDKGKEDKGRRPQENEKKEGKVEEFSVEYWNRIRAELGMKPLPGK